MAAVVTFDTGKAVVRIAAVKIPMDHLLDIGPPETVLPGKMIVINADECFKAILHTAVVIRRSATLLRQPP